MNSRLDVGASSSRFVRRPGRHHFFSQFVLFLTALHPSGLLAMQHGIDSRPVAHIGMVVDGPWRFGEDPRVLFERELVELIGGTYQVCFDPGHNLYGDWTSDGVARAVDSLLKSPDIDVLVAAGLMSSMYVAERARSGVLPVPTIAAAVIDPELQRLPRAGGSSGVRNFNYLGLPNTMSRDLRKFREMATFDRVTILAPSSMQIPEFPNNVAIAASDAGVEIDVVALGETAQKTLTLLGDDVEAVYLFPLPQLTREEVALLAEGLIERKIPSFSFFGAGYVELGILASLNPPIFDRLARRVALNVFDVLQGADAGDLPVDFVVGERLQLNTRTARRIGVYPNWDVIVEAEVIFDLEAKGTVDRALSLGSAMKEGVLANLELLAQDRAVAAGAWEVKRARSNLLPQVDVSTTGRIVDQNLAESSFGSTPERSLKVSSTLTQVLYSEPAAANYSVEQSLQRAREFDREALVLDVSLDVATAYLDVLRAKALEQIEFENVKLTRANLDVARVREQLGHSGPAEVLRWETQIATNRKDQIIASSHRRVAEVVLNQLLNRPLEEPFETMESDTSESIEIPSVRPYIDYVDNPQLFQTFRSFMVGEGLALSPELRAFDEAIGAQERLHAASKRAFWIPDVYLQAGSNTDVAKGGAGSGGTAVELPVDLPESNDTHWNVGINLTYPLFTGLDRMAARASASEKLAQLRTERALNRNLVEQRIRASLELAGGSYAAISQSRKAAQAASETLELVRDAYARGAVPILDLLDAQNSALVTRTVAATTVYDFMADLMRVHRSIGRFDLLSTDDENEAFLKRLDAYFVGAGIDVRDN